MRQQKEIPLGPRIWREQNFNQARAFHNRSRRAGRNRNVSRNSSAQGPLLEGTLGNFRNSSNTEHLSRARASSCSKNLSSAKKSSIVKNPSNAKNTSGSKHFSNPTIPSIAMKLPKAKDGKHAKAHLAACHLHDHLKQDCPTSSVTGDKKTSSVITVFKEEDESNIDPSDSLLANTPPQTTSLCIRAYPKKGILKHEIKSEVQDSKGLAKRSRSSSFSPATSFLNQLASEHNISPILELHSSQASQDPISRPELELKFDPASIGSKAGNRTFKKDTEPSISSPEVSFKQSPSLDNDHRSIKRVRFHVDEDEDVRMVGIDTEQQLETANGLYRERKFREHERDQNLQHLRKVLEQEQELYELRTKLNLFTKTQSDHTSTQSSESSNKPERSFTSGIILESEPIDIDKPVIDLTSSPEGSRLRFNVQRQTNPGQQKIKSELSGLKVKDTAALEQQTVHGPNVNLQPPSGPQELDFHQQFNTVQDCMMNNQFLHQQQMNPQAQFGFQPQIGFQPQVYPQQQQFLQPQTNFQPQFDAQQQFNFQQFFDPQQQHFLQPQTNFQPQSDAQQQLNFQQFFDPQQLTYPQFNPQFNPQQQFGPQQQDNYQPQFFGRQPFPFPDTLQPQTPSVPPPGQSIADQRLAAQARISKEKWARRQQERWVQPLGFTGPPSDPKPPQTTEKQSQPVARIVKSSHAASVETWAVPREDEAISTGGSMNPKTKSQAAEPREDETISRGGVTRQVKSEAAVEPRIKVEDEEL